MTTPQALDFVKQQIANHPDKGVRTPTVNNQWKRNQVSTIIKLKMMQKVLEGDRFVTGRFANGQVTGTMLRQMKHSIKRGRLTRSKAGAQKGVARVGSISTPSAGCDAFMKILPENSSAGAPAAAPVAAEAAAPALSAVHPVLLAAADDEDEDVLEMQRVAREDLLEDLREMQKEARENGDTVPAFSTLIVPVTFIRVEDEGVSLLRFFARKCVTPLTLFPFLAEGSVARTCACH